MQDVQLFQAIDNGSTCGAPGGFDVDSRPMLPRKTTNLVLQAALFRSYANHGTPQSPRSEGMRYSDCLLDIGESITMRESRIAALITGLLLVLSVFCSASFAQDQALIEAAKKGDLKQVQELLEKGADVNAKGMFGQTALMEAANKGHLEVVRLVLKKGADVNTRENSGETALMEAVLGGNPEIVKLIIDEGADANAKSNLDETVSDSCCPRW